MKKFYFLLVALVLGAMSASAVDYYLIGGFNNWTLKQAKCKFTAVSATQYELDYQGQLTTGFKINDGTWSNDNANFGSNGQKLQTGVPYTYAVGGSTGNIDLADGVIDNPHIVLDTAAKTLTISGEQAEVTVSYDIWGNLPAGGSDWKSTEFVEADGQWKATGVTVAAPCNFGIRELTNGSQSAWISGSAAYTISASGSFDCKIEGTNFTITAGTYDLAFDPTAMKLVVTRTGGDDPEPVEHDVYLAGEFNNWTGNDDNYMFEENTDGTYTLELSSLTGNFKVICDGYWLGTTTPVESGVEYSVSDIGMENMALAAPEGKDVVLTFNPNTYKLMVTYESGEVDYSTWYVNVVGDFNNWLDNGVNPNEDGIGEIADLEIGTSPFKVKVWSGVEKWYSNGATVPTDAWTVVPDGAWADPMTIAGAEEGDIYTVSFNVKTNEIMIVKTGTTSVATIEMGNDAAPVYYNLQGVRVDAPANGLYIVVRGDKVAKEVVK